MENADKLATWARDSGLQYLSLLGGEPFLHPELGNIVALFRRVSPGTGLQVLTGGIFKAHLLDGLSPEDFGIIFNVNEPRDYRNPAHFTQVISNVETAIRKGFRVLLGFNVWRMDFDTSFMPELAHRLGRSSFRWTVANPQWGNTSCVVKPDQHRAIAERCLTMLQKAAQLNLEALLDCPLPLCFFRESDLAWVRQYHAGTASRLGACQPVIDVTPELDAIRCFALSKVSRVKLTDFPNEWAIIQWFQKHVDAQLLQAGCFSECGACPHFATGRCGGGCLAWHGCAIEAGVETAASSLARAMYTDLENGNPDSALKLYEKASYWSKTDLPTFLAAVAALRLGKREQSFRLAALAQDMTIEPDIRQRVRNLMTEIRLDNTSSGPRAFPGANPLPFVSFPGTPGEVHKSGC